MIKFRIKLLTTTIKVDLEMVMALWPLVDRVAAPELLDGVL